MIMQLDGITSITVRKPKQLSDCSKCCELGDGEDQCTQDQCHKWQDGEIVLFQHGDLDSNVIIIKFTPGRDPYKSLSDIDKGEFEILVEEPKAS